MLQTTFAHHLFPILPIGNTFPHVQYDILYAYKLLYYMLLGVHPMSRLPCVESCIYI